MDELQQQLPPDLAELAEQFASAAAPFESERDEDATAGGHTAMLEVASFLVGVVGLLVSLIGVYTSGTEARRKRVPDFEELLDGLVAGTTTAEQATAILARWKPELTPVEVAEQLKSGNIERYKRVLGLLGYPPEVVDQILRTSFGAIADLVKNP